MYEKRFKVMKNKKRRSIKAGLPPGSLIHIGKKAVDAVDISVITYDANECKEFKNISIEKAMILDSKPTYTWINVIGLDDVKVIEDIGNKFAIHPLTLEDILNTDQRPKIDFYDDYIFFILDILYYDLSNNSLDIDQLSVILKNDLLITFEEKSNSLLNPLRERIKFINSPIRKQSIDYLMYSVLDTVVDSYFSLLEKIGDQIEYVEDLLIKEPNRSNLQAAVNLRNQVRIARKTLWPVREVVASLDRNGSSLVRQTTHIYLRDVYDHVVQIMDNIGNYMDIMAEMMDLYLSGVGNRTNQSMKLLTFVATIFIPLTFVTGIYGMNFEKMPGLEWEWGFPITMVVMGLIAVIMIFFFKKTL